MANVDSPFGLKPVRDLSGAPYNGAVNQYSTAAGDSTAIFIGDPVTLSGTSQTIDGQILTDVKRATVSGVVVGVVVGVIPVTNDSTIHREASTARIVLVADNPNLIFEIQEVSGGTALTAAAIGLNASFVVGAGNAVTGKSGVEINNATEATTATLGLKIHGFVNREDNAIGEHAKWYVRLNKHQHANQVAGV